MQRHGPALAAAPAFAGLDHQQRGRSSPPNNHWWHPTPCLCVPPPLHRCTAGSGRGPERVRYRSCTPVPPSTSASPCPPTAPAGYKASRCRRFCADSSGQFRCAVVCCAVFACRSVFFSIVVLMPPQLETPAQLPAAAPHPAPALCPCVRRRWRRHASTTTPSAGPASTRLLPPWPGWRGRGEGGGAHNGGGMSSRGRAPVRTGAPPPRAGAPPPARALWSALCSGLAGTGPQSCACFVRRRH